MSGRVRRMTVTVLVDDHVSSGEGVLAEHGLSLHVQADGRSLLFDVGHSGILIGNAARLGIDLASARKVVLSHAHYDHTAALRLLLGAFGPRELISHPDIFARKYARERGRKPRSVGLPHGRRDLVRRGAVLSLYSGPQLILPGVLTSGPIARTTGFETVPSQFAVMSGGRLRADRFVEEQSLIVRTRKGLVVLVGCSHRGVINTLRHVIQITGEKRVHALMGGTHLAPAPERQMRRTIDELRRLRVAHVVACHCTGFRPAARLAVALGNSFSLGGVGFRFTL